MLSPYTGTINFKFDYDDGLNLYIDDVSYNSDLWAVGIFSKAFQVSLVKDKYYTFYTEYCQGYGGFMFILYWDYNGQTQIEIPSSNLFLPSLVGSSPYNIQIVQSIWGDGIITGAEGWDDGNRNNRDGCSSLWSIETGWIWSGGSNSTKDSCSETCGDGKRFNLILTYWDDGNTNNGDGCSSLWSIEIGWTWLEGSNTNPDICKEIWGDGIRFNITYLIFLNLKVPAYILQFL